MMAIATVFILISREHTAGGRYNGYVRPGAGGAHRVINDNMGLVRAHGQQLVDVRNVVPDSRFLARLRIFIDT